MSQHTRLAASEFAGVRPDTVMGRHDRQRREDVLGTQYIFRVQIFLLQNGIHVLVLAVRCRGFASMPCKSHGKAGWADPSHRNLLGGFYPNLACQQFLHQAALLFLQRL